MIPAPAVLPQDPVVFRRRLQHSLRAWEAEGYKVVWLELPIARANLVPVAVEAGFTFHHAHEDYLMLTRRLVDDAFIPAYASHYIGAGGVVLNSANELLVVRERRGRPSRSRSFKLPGGALREGEHLEDGVIREVLEETGILTRVISLVGFRNQHGYRYGKSDIYFVCRLAPLSHEITAQKEEIEECMWMPVDQYLDAEEVSLFNKSIVRAALESPGLAPSILEGYRDRATVEVFLPTNGCEP